MRFLLGCAVGAVALYFYSKNQNRRVIEAKASSFIRRATTFSLN